MITMKIKAVQGTKMDPKTAPIPAKVNIKSELCSQTLGLKDQRIATPTEMREATITGKKKPRTTNIPHENKRANMILNTTLIFDIGIRKRTNPNKTTAPKK